MQFKTTGKETLGLKTKKQEILGAIIINKLEIKKFRESTEFPVYILSILMKSSHLTCF